MTAVSYKWVCLKKGYIPNYSHLIGIMIITIGFRGTLFSDTPKWFEWWFYGALNGGFNGGVMVNRD